MSLIVFKRENKCRLFLLEPGQNAAEMKRKDAEKRTEESGGGGGGGGEGELQHCYELQLSEKPSSRKKWPFTPRKFGKLQKTCLLLE